MRMHECTSSLIARYGYDTQANALDIEFKSGGRWRYFDVPMDTFVGFLRAGSKGKYFLSSIKGKFKEGKC